MATCLELWPEAECWRVCAGGYADKLLLHPLPEPHFLAVPNGVLDFLGPEINPSTLFRNLIF